MKEAIFEHAHIIRNGKQRGLISCYRKEFMVAEDYSYEEYVKFYQKQGLDVLSKADFLSLNRISEQTNTLALLYDCVPEERKQSVLDVASRVRDGKYRQGAPAGRSVGTPKEGETRDGIVMVGSPFFLYFSLGMLLKYRLAQDALNIMRSVWGGMLEKGINTCWETFQMSETHYTRSICHGWSSGPSIYLTEEILGVKPLEPGLHKICD